jgi:hypothetical protein
VTLRIDVTDLETGDNSSAVIATGDYFVVTANPCFVDGIQTYPLKGTHVLTIKKHNPQPIPEKFKAESQG